MSTQIVTYDISAGHKTFLTSAQAQGLLYVIKAGDELLRLPNTTLWGDFPTREDAIAAFDRALIEAKKSFGPITLEKRLTVSGSPSVRSDRKKSPEARWTGRTDHETCDRHQRNDPYFK